ncbi:GFA family protein [Sphingomonas sp. HDW15A]|uniref:GFA family protein n=1 Tax=Sphingomonas sp. HDW15A TaxID=2714942 RepID=UPI00140749CB|nr:GFA family protein [Sphingomonas sp. HDW15A]QIK96303.1 GFA family protein [Sphingomonas sp. HDW15A]
MPSVTGGCHCGAVRFEAEVDTSSGIECDCSYCSKSGNLLAFTGADSFRPTSGMGDLTDYRFNKKVIAHLFCKHCGIGAFGRGTGPDGREMAAINLRCVDGIDLDKVERKPFNGAAL